MVSLLINDDVEDPPEHARDQDISLPVSYVPWLRGTPFTDIYSYPHDMSLYALKHGSRNPRWMLRSHENDNENQNSTMARNVTKLRGLHYRAGHAQLGRPNDQYSREGLCVVYGVDRLKSFSRYHGNLEACVRGTSGLVKCKYHLIGYAMETSLYA